MGRPKHSAAALQACFVHDVLIKDASMRQRLEPDTPKNKVAFKKKKKGAFVAKLQRSAFKHFPQAATQC